MTVSDKESNIHASKTNKGDTMTTSQKQAYYEIGNELNNHPIHQHSDKVTFMAFITDHAEMTDYLSFMASSISSEVQAEVINSCGEIQASKAA